MHFGWSKKSEAAKSHQSRQHVGEWILQVYLQGLIGPKALHVLLSNDAVLLQCLSK